MKILSLNKIEKLKLIGLCVKSTTAVFGGSLILSEHHPYLTLSVLAVGGIANEIVSYIKEKENAMNIAVLTPTPTPIPPADDAAQG